MLDYFIDHLFEFLDIKIISVLIRTSKKYQELRFRVTHINYKLFYIRKNKYTNILRRNAFLSQFPNLEYMYVDRHIDLTKFPKCRVVKLLNHRGVDLSNTKIEKIVDQFYNIPLPPTLKSLSTTKAIIPIPLTNLRRLRICCNHPFDATKLIGTQVKTLYCFVLSNLDDVPQSVENIGFNELVHQPRTIRSFRKVKNTSARYVKYAQIAINVHIRYIGHLTMYLRKLYINTTFEVDANVCLDLPQLEILIVDWSMYTPYLNLRAPNLKMYVSPCGIINIDDFPQLKILASMSFLWRTKKEPLCIDYFCVDVRPTFPVKARFKSYNDGHTPYLQLYPFMYVLVHIKHHLKYHQLYLGSPQYPLIKSLLQSSYSFLWI